MKTITKIVLSVTIVVMCCTVIHLLQKENTTQLSFMSNIQPVGSQGNYYNAPEMPVYKSSGARYQSNGSATPTAIKPVDSPFGETMMTGNNLFSSTSESLNTINSSYVESNYSKRVSPAVDNNNNYGFYVYGSLPSNNAKTYGLTTAVSKPGTSISITDTGEGQIDPDDGDTPPPPPLGDSPVPEGMWVLIALAGGYLLLNRTRRTKKNVIA